MSKKIVHSALVVFFGIPIMFSILLLRSSDASGSVGKSAQKPAGQSRPLCK